MATEVPQIVLLDGAARGVHYAALRDNLDAHYIVDHEPLESGIKPEQIDLALVSDEFHSLITAQLVRLRHAGVPVLHVVDGILEWRNTWENPRSETAADGMPLFQPVLSDKIACFGRAQARILESWGNLGKCEVVGAPRCDHLLGRRPRERREGEPLRLLIMTARTPGFTPDQVDACCRSLIDLQKAVQHWNTTCSPLRIEPVWRVAQEAAARLTAQGDGAFTTSGSLADTLASIDAVVTTPSTVMLESMLQGVPVALLDYTNSPHYVPAAWTITARTHIETVLHELVCPPESKMVWQDTILHDNLECRTPATPRLVELVQRMVSHCRVCRAESREVQFPPRMLWSELPDHQLPPERYDLRRLYPNHPVFAQRDLAEVQAALGHAELQIKNLRKELADSYLAQHYYWKYTLAGRVQKLLGKWRRKA